MRALALLVVSACGREGFDVRQDGSSDGTPDDTVASADASGFCGATGHTFCDDFDRTTAVGAPWDAIDLTGGELTIVVAPNVSPPGAMRADLHYPPAGTLFLTKYMPVLGSHVHVTLDLNVAMSDGAAEIDLASLAWIPPPSPCTAFGFNLVRKGTTSDVYLQETYPNCGGILYHDLSPAAAAFQTIEIDVDVATQRLTVTAGGTTKLDITVAPAIPQTPLRLTVGESFVGGQQSAWRVLYDNVAIDVL